MDSLFLFLFLASFACLIIGIIKPTVFSRFIKGEATRKKVGLIFGIATVAFFVMFGMATDTDKQMQPNTNGKVAEQKEESKHLISEEQTKKVEEGATTNENIEEKEKEKEASPPEAEKKESISTQTTTPKFPSLSEETMDKNLILSCAGGDEVVLWDKPTDAGGGARFKYRVPCGTFGWAFNKYYNEELKIIFYAINTNDARIKNAYGWITEDLITWR